MCCGIWEMSQAGNPFAPLWEAQAGGSVPQWPRRGARPVGTPLRASALRQQGQKAGITLVDAAHPESDLSNLPSY